MRVKLLDLSPNTQYYLQLRSNNGAEVSEWSQRFSLTTISDTIAPAGVTGLTWQSTGTSFLATWNAVITNANGTVLRDFDHYEVTITGGGDDVVYKVTQPRFDFTIEANGAAFGSPTSPLDISVKAVDKTGNKSTAATATATNPVPANVTGLAATGIPNAIIIKWERNTEDDIKYYEVHASTSGSGFTPDSGNLIYRGPSTSFVYDTSTYTTHYIKARAVDIFGQGSAAYVSTSATPQSTTGVDADPPDPPTSVTVSSGADSSDPSGGTRYIDVSWTAPADTDLQNYTVRYSTSSSAGWSYLEVPEGTTAVRINNLKPGTNYYVGVSATDYAGNTSSFANAGTYPIGSGADTTAPAAVTGIAIAAGVRTVTVSWNESADADVAFGRGLYEIQLDTANTFATGNLRTNKVGGTITSFGDLVTGTTYYARVRAVDASGNNGAWSSIVNATTGNVTDSDIAAGSITGDRITAGTLNGDRVIANTLDADRLKANTAFVNNLNVRSKLTIDAAGGSIESSNYVVDTSGFKLDQSSLIINSGSIKASTLLLQDSDNILLAEYTDFEYNSSFYTGLLGSVDATVSIDPLVARLGSASLKVIHTANTVGEAILAANATTYNIEVEQNTDYILSAYAKSASGTPNASVGVKLANATVANSSDVATNASTWTRVYFTFNSGANSTLQVRLRAKNSGTISFDSVQLERKVGALNTPSQWKRPGQTRIDGYAIRTGEIRSSNTITVNGVAQPNWSINLAGNMQVGDALIRGKLIVGTVADADAGQSYIQSGNFSSGTAGWSIKSDGNVEFNSGIFRGTLGANVVTTGSIGNNVFNSNLVKNPGFEEVNLGWTTQTIDANNRNFWETATGSVGPRSGLSKMVFRTINMNTVATISEKFRVDPSSTYNLSFFVAGTGRVDTALQTSSDGISFTTQPITIEVFDAAGANYFGLKGTTSVPAGHTWGRIYIANTEPQLALGAGVQSVLYVDDVSLSRYGYGAAELSAAGLRLFDGEGDETINLSASADKGNYLTISDDGIPLSTVSNDGQATFQKVTTPVMNLSGRDYETDWYWQQPWGIQAWGPVSTPISTTTEVGVAEIGFEFVEGRMYRIYSNEFLVQKASPAGYIGLRLRDGGSSTPTTSSAVLTYGRYLHINISSGNVLSTLRFDRVFRCRPGMAGTPGSEDGITPGLHRILLTLYNANGGAVNIFQEASPSTKAWVELYIEDIGPLKEDTGLVNNSGSSTPPAATKKNYVTAWPALWSQCYKTTNAQRTDIGANIAQGYYSSVNGNQKSMISFAGANSYGSEVNKTIAQALSGATVQKVEAYFYFYHWYYNSGGTAVIGYHGNSGGSPPATASGITANAVQSASWPKPGGRWVTLPNASIPYSGWAAGTIRGLALGPGPSGSALYYGTAYGYNQGAYKPILRMYYTK